MRENYLKKRLLVALVLTLSMFGFVAKAQIDIFGRFETTPSSFNGCFIPHPPDAMLIFEAPAGDDYGLVAVLGPVFINYAGAHRVPLEGPTLPAISKDGLRYLYTFTQRNPIFERRPTNKGLVRLEYNRISVPSGTPPNGYVLANKEVYSIAGDLSYAHAVPMPDTSFNNAKPNTDVRMVFKKGDSWSFTLTPEVTEMSFAKPKLTLGTDLFDSEHFSLYPNPVDVNANDINFTLPNNVNQLNIDIYNITGALVKTYQNVDVQTGENTIENISLAQGMYLLRFTFNKGAKVITKRLMVK